MKRASVIIPTRNEAENIKELLESLITHLQQSENPFEIIVVDDSSVDGTQGIVKNFSQQEKRIQLLARKATPSLPEAILDGFNESSGDILVVMDADHSHPPSLIPRLIDAVKKQPTHLAFGSRYIRGGNIEKWNPIRHALSKSATLLAKKICHINDPLSGCFALSKNKLLGVDLSTESWKLGLEIACKTKAPIIEIPYTFSNRKGGKSKVTVATAYRFIRHLRMLRRESKEIFRSSDIT